MKRMAESLCLMFLLACNPQATKGDARKPTYQGNVVVLSVDQDWISARGLYEDLVAHRACCSIAEDVWTIGQMYPGKSRIRLGVFFNHTSKTGERTAVDLGQYESPLHTDVIVIDGTTKRELTFRDISDVAYYAKLPSTQRSLQRFYDSARSANAKYFEQLEWEVSQLRYIDQELLKAGAVKTVSGLVFIPAGLGTGATPTSNSVVKIAYEGRRSDGRIFVSTDGLRADPRGPIRGPVTVAVNKLNSCLIEGLLKLRVGGGAQLVCPAGLAFGDRGSSDSDDIVGSIHLGSGNGVRPGETVHYEIGLIEILK